MPLSKSKRTQLESAVNKIAQAVESIRSVAASTDVDPTTEQAITQSIHASLDQLPDVFAIGRRESPRFELPAAPAVEAAPTDSTSSGTIPVASGHDDE